jgi:carbonic anhydrase
MHTAQADPNKGSIPGLERLLENNRRWARAINAAEPDFFPRTAAAQKPEYLWIGCADSRVSAEVITGLKPGELFVHRNLGNIVSHSDLNCMSLLNFALDSLGVRNIILCGHYGCGAVEAALTGGSFGVADYWFLHLKAVYRKYESVLESEPDAARRSLLLCRLNVFEQVHNTWWSPPVQNSLVRNRTVTVRGLLYSPHTGFLEDPGISLSRPEDINSFLLYPVTNLYFNLPLTKELSCNPSTPS